MSMMTDITTLREQTGAGMLDCKNALVECGGDMDKAADWLREKGIAKAAKKQSRIAAEGSVFLYNHMNGKIGVMLELNCETDFVAKNEDFQTLGHDICLHIAANAPKYVSAEEYSRQSGMGVEEIKRLCRIGEIKCLRTKGGYYKIPVYNDDVVSKELYEEEKQKRIEAETKLSLLKQDLNRRR